MIEDTGLYPMFCVFPEGGTTNGTSILKFKRGAFESMRPIKPVVLNYGWGLSTLSPAWDVPPFLPFVVLQLSLIGYSCDVIELPVFKPNEYLLTTHHDKGDKEWEIFAWAVREVMCEAS